jgi:hypothetical protein
MKYLVAFSILVLTFFVQNSYALTPKIDSVYADSIYNGIKFGSTKVTNPDSALGKPDAQFAAFTSPESLLDIAFRNAKHNNLVAIKSTSTILVWGRKDVRVDSSAGQVVFYKAAPDGTLLAQSQPIILEDGLNVIPVPGNDFTYIELSIYADPGPKQFAKSYLVDAVALLQDTTTPSKGVSNQPLLVNALSSYPNPFVTTTTVHFELQTEGKIELEVVDALGRTVNRIDAGYEQSGIHEVPVAIKTSGLYFVRLFVNGQPVGNPLKISSR